MSSGWQRTGTMAEESYGPVQAHGRRDSRLEWTEDKRRGPTTQSRRHMPKLHQQGRRRRLSHRAADPYELHETGDSGQMEADRGWRTLLVKLQGCQVHKAGVHDEQGALSGTYEQ
eukprot:14254253-Heterocapsa_arctica.AAC.1